MPDLQESNVETKAKSPDRTPRKRLNLDLTPDSYALLQKLADDSGRSMSDVLRIGLALYSIADEEAQKGRSLGVIKDKEVIKEIVTAI
jgi:Ribbon-helix-helix protein, copG family